MAALRRIALPCLAGLLCACEADVAVDLTTSPAEGAGATLLRLAVTSVELLAEDDESLEHDGPGDDFNLLAYTDGGLYEAASLSVDSESTVVGVKILFDDDATLDLDDGRAFDLAVEEAAAYADIDFDPGDDDGDRIIVTLELPFSLIGDSDGYGLRPVFRAVRAAEAANLSGTMSASYLYGRSCSDSDVSNGRVAAYLYEGADRTPSDYYLDDGVAASVQPYAAATVEAWSDGTGFSFSFYYLPSGSYTVAVSCEADEEDPESLDGLAFIDRASVTLEAGDDAAIEFPD